MNAEFLRGHFGKLFLVIAAIFALGLFVGCGSSDETMYEEETAEPVVSEQARLQYRADSLMNENRRLQDQVDALTAEHRNLTARNAELETKLAEAAAPPPAPVVTDPSEAYRAALGQFNARDYSGALEGFGAILGSGSAGELADNCQYWMGECYYGMGKYSEALQDFEKVMEYNRSGKIPYATLMIGNCQAAMGNKAAAVETYQKVISGFPTSPVADKARAKLGKM
jgi:tol-pal system protein YbgF